MKYKIGLDVSGGDKAPLEIIKGAILAKNEFDHDIVLIGKNIPRHQLVVTLDTAHLKALLFCV